MKAPDDTERINILMDLIGRWGRAIDNGIANVERVLFTHWSKEAEDIEDERADKLVDLITHFCGNELRKNALAWKTIGMQADNKPIDSYTDYSQLSPIARKIFACEVFSLRDTLWG